jgi:hypothetical protein
MRAAMDVCSSNPLGSAVSHAGRSSSPSNSRVSTVQRSDARSEPSARARAASTPKAAARASS